MVSKASLRHIEKLANAAHGITAPFVCGGVISLENPVSIKFASGSSFEVSPASSSYEQARQDASLVHRMTPARFGRGRRTLRDAQVREGLQLNAEGGAFSIEGFDPKARGILETIQREISPGGGTIEAELYSLNLYPGAGHFQPHKDTPRSGSMLGTLVVCLPSLFSNGQLVVVHRGAYRVFDWGRAIEEDPDPKKLRWAAFFGDVDHAIERVYSGHRLTATWLLRQSDGGEAVRKPVKGELPFAKRLGAALAAKSFLVPGGTLAFPCFHMYSSDPVWLGWNKALTASKAKRLKGRDQVIARAAVGLGLETRLVPTLLENCADQTWQLERFPTKDEIFGLGGRVAAWDLEEKLPLSENEGQGDPKLIWVYSPPLFNESHQLYKEGQHGGPIFEDVPALEYLYECEYSNTGYFGNEGGPVDFYLYAALHVTVPRSEHRSAKQLSASKKSKKKRAKGR